MTQMARWFKIFIIVAQCTGESRCTSYAFIHMHTTASLYVIKQQSTVCLARLRSRAIYKLSVKMGKVRENMFLLEV